MFSKLKKQLQERFTALNATGPLFYVEIDREKVFQVYLEGFPEGNRQEHNCNACKSFLRQFAGIVAISPENTVMTLWDFEAEEEYAQSIKNLHRYISSLPITDVFGTELRVAGVPQNKDRVRNLVWEHFSFPIPGVYVFSAGTLPTHLGNRRESRNVFYRWLDELTVDSMETVLELIGQDSIYRGKEFSGLVQEALNIKKQFIAVPPDLRGNFAWRRSTGVSEGIARLRNSAIGTLLVNLSEGMGLDDAVSKFEAMVAPTNYKRPTALVTPRMVDDAKEKLSELGLLPALDRRFANQADLNVNDILYTDKSSSLSDVFQDMKKDTEVNPKSLTKVEEVSIDDFLNRIVPKAKAISVLLENSHLGNMATLVTSIEKDAPKLFKWDNSFSWAYTGGITDSIKERVKAAGGKVDGELRVSLSWFNYDDLDLHVHEPNGSVIYFRMPRSRFSDGQLDVDMNAGFARSKTPVENIIFTDSRKMIEGVYKVLVNQYSQRETSDTGFQVQIECQGQQYEFAERASGQTGKFHEVTRFEYTRANGIKFLGDVKSNVVTKEKWGLKTNRFHKVKNIVLSPNHWNGQVGNKHYMFILEHCTSDEQTRPFFNEFLKPELDVHRKFFEILGDKLKLTPPPNQLSGLGFSETKRNHLHVQVDGNFKRVLKVNF